MIGSLTFLQTLTSTFPVTEVLSVRESQVHEISVITSEMLMIEEVDSERNSPRLCQRGTVKPGLDSSQLSTPF